MPASASIVIPAFERADTVARAVRSVLRAADALDPADAAGVEVLVVDDGSTDGTDGVVAALAAEDGRVRLLRQRHAGVAAARNAGAAAATGDPLLFLDADDEAERAWLAAHLAALRGGADLVFCEARAVRPGEPDRRWAIGDLGPAFAGIRGLFNPGMFGLHREDFDAVGGYAEGLAFSENTELGLRLVEHLLRASRLRIVTVPEPLVVVHRPADGRARADQPEIRLASARHLLEHDADLLGRDRALLGSYEAIAGVAAARLGRLGEARVHLARAARARPTPRRLGQLALACVPPLARRRWATTSV